MFRRRTREAKLISKRRRWLRIFGIAVAVLGIIAVALVAIPVISPSAGASVADFLRSVFGPGPVASLESVSLKIQDVLNQTRYQMSGGQPQLTWESADPPNAQTSRPDLGHKIANSRSVAAAPLPDAVAASPSVDGGWQAFGPSPSAAPIMARASVKPDPSRPYAQAALVRIDLSVVQLHIMPGTLEPVAAQGTPHFPRPGAIPADVQAGGKLVAAFNGGFKAIHGHYGMMVNDVTILPPQNNIATLAVYRNGSVRIGAWGRDIQADADLAAYRQNCPLLVDSGQINPGVKDGSRQEWGYTVQNLDTTWRSGVGISRDGRFLIYAVGNSLTVDSLARALQMAGAYSAMQLDINSFYTRFVTYQPAASAKARFPVTAQKLLSQMIGDPAGFLSPYDRDFFYITYGKPAFDRSAKAPTG